VCAKLWHKAVHLLCSVSTFLVSLQILWTIMRDLLRFFSEQQFYIVYAVSLFQIAQWMLHSIAKVKVEKKLRVLLPFYILLAISNWSELFTSYMLSEILNICYVLLYYWEMPSFVLLQCRVIWRKVQEDGGQYYLKI
jgi:hypothetical protein